MRDGLSKAGAALDEGLARKQRELDADPHERVEMILEEIEAADSRFEELEDRVHGQTRSEDEADAG